jgi:hypothetical protein
LIPFLRLRHATSLQTLETVFFLGVGAVVVAFVLLPRRALLALPALLLATGIAASVEVSRYVAAQARLQKASFVGPDPRWVDHATSDPVAYVYAGEHDWNAAWQTFFWNRRVDRVYDFGRSTLPGPAPQRSLVAAGNGFLTPRDDSRPPVDRAVVASSFEVGGSPIAQPPGVSVGEAGLRLWEYEPPLRLVYRTTGLQANGDIYGGGDGAIVAYSCGRGGTFVVTLLIKTPGTINVLRDGMTWRRLSFATPGSSTIWRGHIPAPPRAGGVCRLDIEPSGLTGTTTFLFQPG